MLVYSDRIDNPVVEGMSRSQSSDSASAAALLDPASGLLRATGPRFSTAGVAASIQHNLPGGNSVRLTYANGDALAISAASSSCVWSAAPLVDQACRELMLAEDVCQFVPEC